MDTELDVFSSFIVGLLTNLAGDSFINQLRYNMTRALISAALDPHSLSLSDRSIHRPSAQM